MTTYPGAYRALVIDNADPQQQGRLRLRIPQITGAHITAWAWPMQHTASIPAKGSGVFAMFEGGDLAYPLWIGSFGDRP